jgi:hypothetical protein
VVKYNQPSFIAADPISVPHQYSKLQDIEIAGFFTAIMSWGQRVTIINKANELMQLMDKSPFDFIKNHQPKDGSDSILLSIALLQPDDVIYLVEVSPGLFSKKNSLEDAFADHP